MERAIVNFINKDQNECAEIDIPLDITSNDLIYALNESFSLGLDSENIIDYYLVTENPIAFLKGNKLLDEYGIRNGTDIIFKRR